MVDLARIANRAATVAFNVAGTAIQSVTYNQKGAATYSPVSGVAQTTSVIQNVRMLMQADGKDDQEKYIVRADFTGKVKATVIASELGITPKSNDTVTWGGITRIISGVMQADPTGALYELTLGEPD